MKNTLSILLIVFLIGNSVNIFAQRNANQTKFKSISNSRDYNDNYQILNDELQQGFFETDNANYTQSYSNGITQYIGPNEIIFEVRTLMNVRASKFLAVFNLTQVGETAAKTDELINSRINAFMAGIKEMGIDAKNTYIDMIYLIPTFEYTIEKKLFSKTYNEVPTGFEMQKNIHVTFTDINLVDDLVTLAAKNEIYDLVKVDFFVDNIEHINDTLISASTDFLNRKLKTIEKLNINLSDKYHVIRDATSTVYPETQYTDYDAFVSQSVEAIKKNTGVTSIRKPTTVAYNQIPYNNFNIVINPAILEPVVQFIYKMQVKYTIDKPEVKKEITNKYMLVTPAGDIKPLILN